MSFRRRIALVVGALCTALIPVTGAVASDAGMRWTAPAERVEFESSGVKLVGDLYLPCSAGPHPLVIALHAASSPTRELALYDHLKQMLPALGIGAFVYDRRGSGESQGQLADTDYAALADDGIAASRKLASDPRIDPGRIGFWGLSQGGWLSVLAASRAPEAVMAIAVSAPMVTPDVQMNFAVGNILRIKGFSEAEIDEAVATRSLVDRYMKGELPRPPVERAVEQASTAPWFDYSYIGRLEQREDSRWAREMTHDPLVTLRGTQKPVLVVYGSADPWIPVQESVSRLRELIRERANLTVHVVSGADHAMMYSFTPEQQIDPSTFIAQRPEAPEYFAVLAAWLVKRGFAEPEQSAIQSGSANCAGTQPGNRE